MSINYCNSCNEGWLPDHRSGNSLAGEPCGCEVYHCDECDVEISNDERTSSNRKWSQDLCNSCLAETIQFLINDQQFYENDN